MCAIRWSKIQSVSLRDCPPTTPSYGAPAAWQVIPSESDACRCKRRTKQHEPAPQADRNPSRGHRQPASINGPNPRLSASFYRVLRRFIVRRRRHDYKSLKAVLEGGIEGRPDNVIFYATSNRRHLMSRDMMENERSTAINPGETVEEKVSLSDRFGLWLGFHRCSQDEYLAMVDGYVTHYKIPARRESLHREALEWSTTRGSRSGRVAWQFVQDLAGRLGVTVRN